MCMWVSDLTVLASGSSCRFVGSWVHKPEWGCFCRLFLPLPQNQKYPPFVLFVLFYPHTVSVVVTGLKLNTFRFELWFLSRGLKPQGFLLIHRYLQPQILPVCYCGWFFLLLSLGHSQAILCSRSLQRCSVDHAVLGLEPGFIHLKPFHSQLSSISPAQGILLMVHVET